MSSRIHRSRTVRTVYVILGFISLGIGAIGVVTPLLPGTEFVMLSAFFFARSSDRLHRWLMGTRFGALIADYQAGRGLPKRVKIVATLAIVIAFGAAILFALDTVVGRSIVAAVGLFAVWFVLSRPSRDPDTKYVVRST